MEDRFNFRFWTGKMMGYFDLFCNPYDMYKVQKDKMLIMQSTGLKDKNGKLVFEGDIVKSYNDEICEIKYCKSECMFEICSKWNDHPMCNLDFKFEIIGNIYENKELLEVQNG